MTPEEYIAACLRTESDLSKVSPLSLIEKRVIHAIDGINDEAGELIKIVKARTAYDAEFDFTNLIEEAGDLLWYVSLLLDSIGSSYEEVMEKNIAKLKARYPKRYETDKALHRDLATERKALEAKDE